VFETGDPPEPWNLIHKDRIRALHQGFVDAGSDLFLTNSFGGTSFRLKLHNLENQVFELNKAAGVVAREVADHADRLVIVAGAMGPTGEMIEPHGLMTPNEATAAFRAQAEGLAEGGVDVLWLETMYAMEELEAAIDAVKDIGLPVCATMSFDTAGKTMMGITPSNFAKISKDLNLMGFGANCGIKTHCRADRQPNIFDRIYCCL
jgi:5-methyltetrahydrofolate--homocysteine methyltransferase